MGKANVFACDAGGCDATATAADGAVAPPGWALFQIDVKSQTPLPTGKTGGHRSAAQTRAVYCCPAHAARLLDMLPVPGAHPELPPARREERG